MPVAAPSSCPYLGLASDRTLSRTMPDLSHRCFAQTPPGAPDLAHQSSFCLAASHTACPFYTAPPATAAASTSARPKREAGRTRQWRAWLPWAILAVALVAVGLVYARDLVRPPAAPPQSAQAVPTPVVPTPGASPTRAVGTAVAAVQPARPVTPTPEPGGRALALAPKSGDAGWWTSKDARGNHLGDSFLYAGYNDGNVFVSALRFELAGIPRGAPVREAVLRLTGLQADRFDPAAGGAWSVQLLPADALKDYARTDFQTLFNAPAAISLLPPLAAADLSPNRENDWALDAGARAWLQDQVAAGATSIIARIVGPTGGESTLFAWDGGSGPASAGAGPQISLSLGPAPATPPALPSQQVIAATASPTPANVLTAAADRMTATAVARTTGTYTPAPYRLATPTPFPANLATVQALRMMQGLPPLVIYTPVPANEATAAANAAYATAVAMTTGTFTPVPTNAVTAVIVLPTPIPENVMTAAAQILAATRSAAQAGTATPLPVNAIIATVTPTSFVVPDTPVPANAATAAAQSAYATAVAFFIGTATPLPPNAWTVTPTPLLPLLLYEDQMTPRPTPTPTPAAPASMPATLIGKILFMSDRDGQPAVYALEVPTGRVALVTQAWPYGMAAITEARSRDGRYIVSVRDAPGRVKNRITGGEDTVYSPHVFVEDTLYQTTRQVTTGVAWNYDAALSPAGDRIAYVSTEPGNDEVFTIAIAGGEPRRLTVNTWEWDKHPSWSPDGQQIVFYSNRGVGRRQLWIMNADGSNQRRLLDSPYDDWDPIWVK